VYPQHIGVRVLLLEVSILNAITGIGQHDSRHICTKLLDAVLHRQRVTRALAHLLPVQHQMAVRPYARRPLVFWEQCGVVIDAEGQMVGYQILSRRPDVEGIEVVEVGFQVVQVFLWDGRNCGEGTIAENILPDLIVHLRGFDSHLTWPLSLNVLCNI